MPHTHPKGAYVLDFDIDELLLKRELVKDWEGIRKRCSKKRAITADLMQQVKASGMCYLKEQAKETGTWF